MKISKKLILGFLTIALLVTVVGLFSVYAVEKSLQKRIQNESVLMPSKNHYKNAFKTNLFKWPLSY